MSTHTWVIVDDSPVKHEFASGDPAGAILEWLAQTYEPRHAERMIVIRNGDIGTYAEVDAPGAEEVTRSSWRIMAPPGDDTPGAPWIAHPHGAHRQVYLAVPLPAHPHERVLCRLRGCSTTPDAPVTGLVRRAKPTSSPQPSRHPPVPSPSRERTSAGRLRA